MNQLQSKRVLITGAGRGLGRELALRFAAAGATIIVTDIDTAAAEAVANELKSAEAHRLDVTDDVQIQSVRAQVLPIDVLVNNAGVVFGGEFSDVSVEQHRMTAAVNFAGLMALTHAFLPDLIDRPEAHIVNIVSASAFIPLPFGAAYAASKWAALGFTESLREELRILGRRHIGITAVLPSYIATGMFEGVKPPLFTRWLTPQDVADATVKAVLHHRDLVYLPRSVRFSLAMASFMPWTVWRRIVAWSGVGTSMRSWKGRQTGSSLGA